MKRSASLIVIAAALGTTSCSSELAVRSIKQPLAEGRQPTNFRLAEGASHPAFGNVGLALEAFRKAQREDPASVEAMIGLATCYDRMGRYDLSRRQFETALAVDPTNTELYSLFAQSLEAQGHGDEAARVKAELAERSVAPEAPREAPGSVPVLPPPPAQSVAVTLAPSRPAPVAVERSSSNVRLERLSMREVALVTRAAPRWETRTVAQTATSTTVRFDRKAPAPVTLLNAARVHGLAARTRAYLAERGFAGVRIGDAPAVRQRSAIVYAAADERRAQRIASQFGFDLERRNAVKGGLTILLGRDAARDRALARRPA